MIWYDSNIIRIEQAAPNVRRFWLKIANLNIFSFSAGQFITMDLPISEKRLKRWRSYSIANAPNESAVLEFCIVRSPQGLGTKYLFEEATIGSPIRFKGPDGAFILKQASVDKDLVFICTGTGVAPFRSILWDIANKKIPHRNIHLIFGTRYRNGILYEQDWNELSNLLPNFRFSAVFSRENNGGYIHNIYMNEYANSRPNIDFYLCGWSNMIDEAVTNLVLKLGYDKSQIHYELYG